MIKRLFSKSKARTFVNGAQETVEISSQADDFKSKTWFSDTVTLSKSLSKGDRSGPLAAKPMVDAGDTPSFMTAPGSVTQELWERMTHFGYGTSSHGDILPGSRVFVPHPDRFSALLSFLIATQVNVVTGPAVAVISEGLSHHYTWWSKLPRDVLVKLRMGFDRKREPMEAPSASENPLFSEFAKIGVVEMAKDTEWPVTDLGMVMMPFLFDHLIFRHDETFGRVIQ